MDLSHCSLWASTICVRTRPEMWRATLADCSCRYGDSPAIAVPLEVYA